uniref:Uncharacterized protein n=1 Tax=uncultured prokaryote TaxID=198431 RepID=A0A0H5Q2S2_9ZZZZ|nr:hypothetical protein [uncultured prokaryote]
MARRIHTELRLEGIQVDGNRVIFVQRMWSETTKGRMQGHGPLLLLEIGAEELLDDDVTNAMETAYQKCLIVEKLAQAARDEAGQPTLFVV